MGASFISIGNFRFDNVAFADGRVELRNISGNTVYSASEVRNWSEDVGISTTIPQNNPTDWLINSY